MSKNDVSKQSPPFDFFTETVICFTIKSVEHKIKLAIYGIFQPEEDKVVPIPTKFKIIEVQKENQLVETSPKVIQFVNKWVKNNPNKFSSFAARELGIMIKLAAAPISKTSPLSKNTVDNK